MKKKLEIPMENAPGSYVRGGNSWIARTMAKIMGWWSYVSEEVWRDTRPGWFRDVIRTLSLSVRSFLNGDIQTQACAMTYRMLLAIVPALALAFAIARGFGFQTVLQKELFHFFPAQKVAVGYALEFVDSYLNQASEGIFVGVGIVFLLYTLISLVVNVEDTFNKIWGIKEGRSLWRKISDYMAMFLIFPILMICVSGINILLSSTLETIFHFSFMTPLISVFLELASWVLTWLFFASVYILIPNTKVKFKYAVVPGMVAGTAFIVLQWLFVTGQMYVSRYNAIYGSFSFLPLLLIWMQLVWVITLSGAVLCYSSQNIFRFSFDKEVETMSPVYRGKVMAGMAAVVAQRFARGEDAATGRLFVEAYKLPARLVSDVLDLLLRAGLISKIVIDEKKELFGYQPAVALEILTLEYLIDRINSLGAKGFIPDFDECFPGVDSSFAKIDSAVRRETSGLRLDSIDIKLLDLKNTLIKK